MTDGADDAGRPLSVAPPDGYADDPKALVPRDAATIMVVRDGDEGPDVVMVRRTSNAVFAAGAFVFPGGALDDDDRAAVSAGTVTGRTGELGALAYAAVREAFEESAIAVALQPVVATDPFELPDHLGLSALQAEVNAGARSFAGLLTQWGAVVDTASLAYVARWVTPIGETRRFDTRFFMATAPPDAAPSQDDNETTRALWIGAREALRKAEEGVIGLMPPTVANLRWLASFDSAGAAMDAAFARTVVPVQPEIVSDGDGTVRLRMNGTDYDDVVVYRPPGAT
jgi:8-oxo-dGTP pyrophosphatase MutT (NUDIX family)